MSTTNPPSMSASSPQSVYQELVAFFGTNRASILELEILPSSFLASTPTDSPVLQDGCSLAVSKKALTRAFLIAREILLSESSAAELSTSGQCSHKKYDIRDVEAATKVALFYDPEHLTAANWRKRYIKAMTTNVSLVVSEELAFLNSLLTSPLNRHTKSPTLWYHRQWLVHTYHTLLYNTAISKNDLPCGPELSSQEFLGQELDVVLAAAGRHKANYTAFQCGRHLVNMMVCHNECNHGLVERVQRWCLAHPTDISGWAFLSFLLLAGSNGYNSKVYSASLGKAVAAVEAFVEQVEWKGESVEWFLRWMGPFET